MSNGEQITYEVIQFHPTTERGISPMVQLLDQWLKERGRERSILLQRTPRYPTPCVILH